jgi:hypothetical protein
MEPSGNVADQRMFGNSVFRQFSKRGAPGDRHRTNGNRIPSEFQRYGIAKNRVGKTWLSPLQSNGRPVRARTADLYRIHLPDGVSG